jgi:ribosomal-protein-alanine N-acetyltransferase
LQQTTDRIADYQRHQAAHGFSKWVILDRETRRPIGDSGLLVMPQSGDIDLGFRLAQPWWGKGLATEAARAWVRTAFADLDLARLTAFAHPDNQASLRVLRKLGFRYERAGTVMGMRSLVFSLAAAAGAQGVAQTAGPA